MDVSDEILAACARSGMAWREKQVEMDAKAYVRERHLKNIIAVWPHEIEDTSIPGTRHVIARLLKVARAYARIGREMPHHYEMSRHIAILGALRAERAQLAHLQNCAGLARIVGGEAA
jgi:hypothetical protein